MWHHRDFLQNSESMNIRGYSEFQRKIIYKILRVLFVQISSKSLLVNYFKCLDKVPPLRQIFKIFFQGDYYWIFISENSRNLYVADLANDVHCNFPHEALMNTVSSYEAAYGLERISYNFLICGQKLLIFGIYFKKSLHLSKKLVPK